MRQVRPDDIIKIANAARMIGRMAALGAAAGLGGQTLDVGRSAISGDPYLMPQQSLATAVGRGAMGGATAGAILAALGRMFK